MHQGSKPWRWERGWPANNALTTFDTPSLAIHVPGVMVASLVPTQRAWVRALRCVRINGVCSSVVERLVVVQEVGSSILLSHPNLKGR